MILYHCMTNYQLLACVVHKLNYNSNEDAILIYPDYLVRRQANMRKLSHFFVSSYCYPSRELHSTYIKENIMQIGDKIFKNILGCDITKFEKIYVGGVQTPISIYLVLSGIKFAYMEESPCFFHFVDSWMEYIKKENYPLWSILDRLKIITGESEYIDEIYISPLKGVEYNNPKVIFFSMGEEIKKIDKIQLNNLNQLFCLDINSCKNNPTKGVLLLTSPFARYLTMTFQNQGYVHKMILDYFTRGDEYLCIKPHPDDQYDYRKAFPGNVIYNRCTPMELITSQINAENMTALTFNSAGHYNFSNFIFLDVNCVTGADFLYRLHKHYAIKVLYDMFSSDYEFYVVSSISNVFSCWGKRCKELNHMQASSSNAFLFLGGDGYDIELLENAARNKKIIVAFDYIHRDMLRIEKILQSALIVRNINIKGERSSRMESIYIMTNDQNSLEKIKKAEYVKILKYAKEEVRLTVMSEQEMELEALRGQLHATEKRLRQVLEENEDLKEQLQVNNVQL